MTETPRSSVKWPKRLPELTEEQKRISDDFMKYWHEVLPRSYGIVEGFNHLYSVRKAAPGFRRTLEIGAGLGEHLHYEKLSREQTANYTALEMRENMVAEIKRRFPAINVALGDCQTRLDFPEGYFDRILAIHVLEHLPNLPAAIVEMHRLCDKATGLFSVVIPCEGGFLYTAARRLSAQRIFEKRYNQSYRWLIEREHLNKPREIFAELQPYFDIFDESYFPIPIPFISCNLCIGLTLKPRTT